MRRPYACILLIAGDDEPVEHVLPIVFGNHRAEIVERGVVIDDQRVALHHVEDAPASQQLVAEALGEAFEDAEAVQESDRAGRGRPPPGSRGDADPARRDRGHRCRGHRARSGSIGTTRPSRESSDAPRAVERPRVAVPSLPINPDMRWRWVMLTRSVATRRATKSCRRSVGHRPGRRHPRRWPSRGS